MPDAPRIAYLITSYTLPEQVLRLAETLRRGSPRALIALHHDDRRCAVDVPALDVLGVRRVEPPSPVEWGEPSQLEMVLRCLEWLLERSDFDWVVLLSGQDYPIRPLVDIERALAGSGFDAFIEATRVEPPALSRLVPVDEFASRYFYRWRKLPPGAPGRTLLAIAARARPLLSVRSMPSGDWVGARAFRTPFRPGFECHRGSDWFTLRRRAVDAVVALLRAKPEILDHYRQTLIPTESLVQTVLASDPALRISGDYRRFTVWRPGDARPRVLGCDDLPDMLASGADFARKFDQTVDRAVLDEIDRRVHTA
ncbi:MAG TPA: beta-1,6-N-acetylglucosaminyltransferase [Thermoleophilaceae bacterium]|nr:beta-1,6-N-acetylglucosaminyltransferase [Thermoleophilaceae bacterium]